MRKFEFYFTKNLLNWYLPFLYIVCCLFVFPFTMHNLPQGGLDPSWAIAINLAVKNNFVWGKDFVFSYGPLGYLSTGLSEYTSKLFITIFYLGIWLNASVIIYKIIFWSKPTKPIHFLYTLLCAISLRYFIVFDLSTTLLFSCIFWLLYSLQKQSIFAALFAVLISVFMFFIKIDTGFVVHLFIIMFYIYQCLYANKRAFFSLLFVINYIVLYLLCIVLHVDIVAYLTAGFHIINAYNDAMFLPNEMTILLVPLAVFLFFIAVCVSNFKQMINTKVNIVASLFLLMAFFILFKHAFVRHSGDTFIEPPYPLILILYFYYFIRPNKLLFLKPLLAMPVIISMSIKINNHIAAINPSQTLLYTIKTKSESLIYKNILRKQNTVVMESVTDGGNPLLQPYYLPNRIINKIGKSSVDIIPILVSTIYFDSLNYNPRPGIQSYANYDSYLDSKGAEKYLSNSAPDYIVYCAQDSFRNATIDDRYPFFDEPITKLALLQTYSVVDSFDNQLLLKHSNKRKQLICGSEIISNTTLNKPINIPTTSSLQLLKIDISYSLLGKILRFIYQPPTLEVVFTLSDGSKHTYRAIKPILQEGVVVNKFIVKNQDFIKLFSDTNMDKIPKVASVEIIGNEWGFNKVVQLDWQQLNIK